MHEEPGLTTLLDLQGQILDQGDGYWIKIEAWQVAVTEQIPHGIRYSLTLHEPYGTRILGYDNAHGLRSSKPNGYTGSRHRYDHRHRHAKDRGVPYEFTSAYQLLADFFEEVDQVLRKVKKA